MQNYKLTLQYDGSRYRGWQRLGNTDNTIQARLEEVLSRLDGRAVQVDGSGRTDAGVHALGQVTSFCLQSELSEEAVLNYLRRYLPKDIGAMQCRKAPPRFHARLSATQKTYRYRIWNSIVPCVFERNYVYEWPQALDLHAMRQAAELLTGTHDYAAFCANARMKKSTVRTVQEITLQQQGQELWLTFRADGFLYNMARILTGTLLEVGSGKRMAKSIPELFTQKREQAGFTAPAKGLCLMGVTYEPTDIREHEVL